MDDRAKQTNDLVALNGCEGRSKAGKVRLIQKNDRFFPGAGKFFNLPERFNGQALSNGLQELGVVKH